MATRRFTRARAITGKRPEQAMVSTKVADLIAVDDTGAAFERFALSNDVGTAFGMALAGLQGEDLRDRVSDMHELLKGSELYSVPEEDVKGLKEVWIHPVLDGVAFSREQVQCSENFEEFEKLDTGVGHEEWLRRRDIQKGDALAEARAAALAAEEQRLADLEASNARIAALEAQIAELAKLKAEMA